MRRLRAWFRRLGGMFRKAARDRDLAAEIESHLQLHIDDNIRAGMSPSEARRDAVLRFGPVEALKETYRDRRGLPVWETLVLDVRFGARMLMRRPGFTLVAVFTLALGLGANATVASLANATLFRPPAHVEDPGSLVSFHHSHEGSPRLMSYPEYLDYRDRNDFFAGLVASSDSTVHLRARGAGRRVESSLATGNYFEVLGVPPAAGRLLSPQDDAVPDDHPVAVISHRLWLGAFGADPAAVGESIVVNNRRFTIVGVAAPDFRGVQAVSDTDLWVPMMMQGVLVPGRDLLTSRRSGWLNVIARLAPGVSLEQATQRASILVEQVEHETVSGPPAMLFDHVWVSYYARDYLVEVNALLAAVVALILVLACANVSNLLLTQATVRSREMSLRRAIGAGRGRLLRQLTAEGLLLSGCGGVVGMAIAVAGTRLLSRFHLNANLALADAGLAIDVRVITVAAGLSVLVGLGCSLLPAWQSARQDLAPSLRGRYVGGPHGARLRASLVALQVAISFVILVAAGLLVRTLVNLQAIDPGFDAEHAATVAVDLELDGHDETTGMRIAHESLTRLRRIPGVDAVAAADSSPFVGVSIYRGGGMAFVRLDGRELPADHPDAEMGATLAGMVNVTPGYFDALGIPLRAGRPFGDGDDAAAAPVVIVSYAAARSLWPGENPVGQRVRLGTSGDEIVEVVGVVGDIKSGNLTRDAASWMYRPLAQSYTPTLTFVVRGAAPRSLLPEMRSALLEVEPTLTLFRLGTLIDGVGESLWEARLFAGLVGLFGVLALLMAAAGLYGVLSHAVAQRTREMGLRMALGADARDIIVLMSQGTAWMVVRGALLGVALCLWATRYLESKVYGVAANDPVNFVTVAALLALVSTLACLVPVLRATAVDPMVALREE